MIWGLLIAALQTALSLPDPEPPQPVNILGSVVSPTAVSAARKWQRSEPLTEPEPARAYAKCIGRLPDCAVLFWAHADMLNLTDKSC